jgi:electron transport complex protein RnfG
MAKKKLESTFVNMVGALLVVTLVSAAALGSIYNLTKGPIELAKNKKKLKAIQAVVLEGYDNDPSKEVYSIETPTGEKLEAYPAKKSGELTSVAIKTYTKKGFSGEIWLMVGLLADGTINKISVIEQKETPGLGTKIVGPFKDQFYGKNPDSSKLQVKNDGGEIDSITAATISSRAFCDAVDRAYKAFKNSTNL